MNKETVPRKQRKTDLRRGMGRPEVPEEAEPGLEDLLFTVEEAPERDAGDRSDTETL